MNQSEEVNIHPKKLTQIFLFLIFLFLIKIMSLTTLSANELKALNTNGVESFGRSACANANPVMMNSVPGSALITSTSDLITTISKQMNNDSLSKYHIEYEQMKRDLMTHNLQVKLNLHKNINYINDIKVIFDSLPSLIDYSQTKPIIPEFDEIKVLKTDSAEIKKFIRKVNYEMIGYHCNHKVMNEQCDKIFKSISDLYNSQEFKQYNDFIDNLMYVICSVINCDKRNKEFDEPILIPTKNEIKIIIKVIVSLNGKISETNAKTNPECSKCKSAVRKYEYCLREVQRMREELKEQNDIDEQFINSVGEDKYDFREFMKRNYPTIDKFVLKDVKDKYKAEFKKTATYDELINLVNETQMFKVTNVHRTYYVNRI